MSPLGHPGQRGYVRSKRQQRAADPASEDALTKSVLELAERYGWMLRYHTHDSRKSGEGFPDWVFVKPSRLVALELKGARTPVTPEQVRWIALLGTIPGVDAAIIRPSDLQHAADLLGPRRAA